MLFFLRFESHRPANMPNKEWQEVLAAENEFGIKAAAEGKLKGAYLAAGTHLMLAILDMNSIEEVHTFVRSAPLFPYSESIVYPVVDMGEKHRRDAEAQRGNG